MDSVRAGSAPGVDDPLLMASLQQTVGRLSRVVTFAATGSGKSYTSTVLLNACLAPQSDLSVSTSRDLKFTQASKRLFTRWLLRSPRVKALASRLDDLDAEEREIAIDKFRRGLGAAALAIQEEDIASRHNLRTWLLDALDLFTKLLPSLVLRAWVIALVQLFALVRAQVLLTLARYGVGLHPQQVLRPLTAGITVHAPPLP